MKTAAEIRQILNITTGRLSQLNELLTENVDYYYTGRGKVYTDEALEKLKNRPKQGGARVKGNQQLKKLKTN